jgi:hypothetical protein
VLAIDEPVSQDKFQIVDLGQCGPRDQNDKTSWKNQNKACYEQPKPPGQRRKPLWFWQGGFGLGLLFRKAAIPACSPVRMAKFLAVARPMVIVAAVPSLARTERLAQSPDAQMSEITGLGRGKVLIASRWEPACRRHRSDLRLIGPLNPTIPLTQPPLRPACPRRMACLNEQRQPLTS